MASRPHHECQGHSCSKLALPFIPDYEQGESAHLFTFRCIFSEGRPDRLQRLELAGGRAVNSQSFAVVEYHDGSVDRFKTSKVP